MKYQILHKKISLFIWLFFFFCISANVYSQLTYITCNSGCTTLVGQVTFANKNGTTTGRWTVNDIAYGGLADEKFSIKDTNSYKSTSGNLTNTGGGTYTIVSDPGTVNQILNGTATSAPLKSGATDGILLFKSNDNSNPFAFYSIKGLTVGGKYCVRIKMRNAAVYKSCSNSMAVQMQFRSLAGIGISGGGLSGGQWNRVAYNTSCNQAANGGWDGNNQTDGVRWDEYQSIYEINFQIGQNPNNTNDNGFTIYFQTLGSDANDVWGIDEIDVYGCITQQISSSNGSQICQGTPTVLTAMGIGSTTDTYEWRIGNASGTPLPSTSNTLSVTPAAATTYWVKCARTRLTLTTTITPVNCCGPTGLFTIPKVCMPITVDGIIDTTGNEKVWSVAPWVTVDGTKSAPIGGGANDCPGAVLEKPTARFRTIYDNTNIYFFVQIYDANPSNTYPPANSWEMDGIELYLKDATGNPKQFGGGYAVPNPLVYGNMTGTTQKTSKSATYWCLEISIPLTTNNIDVTKGFIGLETAINQSVFGTTCRRAQVCTWTAASDFFSSTSHYHIAPLSNCASVTTSEDSICNGGYPVLSTQLITVNNSPTYTWQSSSTLAGPFVNIAPSPGTTNSVIVTPTATTYYRAMNDGVTSCPVEVYLGTANIGLTYNATAFCEGSTMTLNGSTTLSGAGIQWGWKKGTSYAFSSYIPGYTLSTSAANKTYSKAVTTSDAGNYYFIVDKSGCQGVDSVTIKVNSTPTVTATGGSACSGTSIILTASGSTTYSWNNGSPSPNPTVSPTATTTYTVTGTTNGCSNTAQAVVTAGQIPTVNAGTDVSVCASNSNTTLTETGGVATAWQWSTGANTQSITVSPTTSTTYTVTVINSSGCTNSDNVVVNVNGNLSPIINGKDSICIGTSTTLTVNAGSSFAWNTGLTTTSNSITVSPTSTTVYSVTASNGGMCSGTATKTIVVNLLPTITITNDSVCTGLSVKISASGGIQYLWSTFETTASITVNPAQTTTYYVAGLDSKGCANSSMSVVTVNSLPTVNLSTLNGLCVNAAPKILTEGNPTGGVYSGTGVTNSSFDPAAAGVGNFTITYTLTDSKGCINKTTGIITVNALPTVSLLSVPNICAGNSITVTANSSNTGTYLWQDGSTGSTFNDTPASTSTYYATITDNNGCTAFNHVVVTVNPLPSPTLNDVTICNGGNATLTVRGAHLTWIYNWDNAATSSSLIVNPTITTTYNLTVTDNNCKSAATATVYVLPNPPADAGATVSVCTGADTTLTANGGITYNWSNGQSGQTISVSPAVNTLFTVTVTGANGCIATDTVSVFLISAPSAPSANNAYLCQGEVKNIDLTINNPVYVYNWYTAATGGLPVWKGNTYTIVNEFQQDSIYMEAVTPEGCKSPRGIVRVLLIQRPIAIIDSIMDTIPVEELVLFKSTSQNANSYRWDFGQGEGTASSETAYHRYNTPGIYFVTLTVSNMIGCNDSITDTVAVVRFQNPWVPDVFTPNKDLKNDVLFVRGPYKKMLFEVYNIWGAKVFSTETKTDGWDGTFQGNDQPEGNYAWILNATTIDGRTIRMKGIVTLVR